MRVSLAAAALMGSLMCVATAQQAPKSTLLILSKRDQTLRIVDPVTLKILGTAPVGNDPHEVIASTDGSKAYVSNYGFGAFNTLAVIDLVKKKPLPSIDLGALRGPHGLTFVGGKVYFTAEAAKALGRFDPATHRIDLILGTGQDRTHMVYVSPDSKEIITTNVRASSISRPDAVPAVGAAQEVHLLVVRAALPPTALADLAAHLPMDEEAPAARHPEALAALAIDEDPADHLPVAPAEVKAGRKRSSKSATAPKASMSPPIVKKPGSPMPRMALSPSSRWPQSKSPRPCKSTSVAQTDSSSLPTESESSSPILAGPMSSSSMPTPVK